MGSPADRSETLCVRIPITVMLGGHMKSLRAAWVLAFIVGFIPSVSRASQPPPVTPEELKMTAEPLAPSAPAIILYRQVDRVDNSSASYEDTFMRIKILTDEGRKYGDVEIPYDEGTGTHISKLSARTIRPDGLASEFKGTLFEKEIVKARGWRYMAKTFALADVRVGSVIEYSYRQEFYGYTNFPRWILNEALFTKHAQFSLFPSDKWALSWTGYRLPNGTPAPKQADKMLRLEVSNIPAYAIEDYMPPPFEVSSLVEFTYLWDSEKDVTKFWKNRSKDRHHVVDDFMNRRGAMQHAVSQIVSPGDSSELKAQKIFDRVQKMRNLTVERKKTEQEYRREKQKDNLTVQDVWQHGYGETHDLNWLFLALVRAAGLEAYPVLASDRAYYFFQSAQRNPYKLFRPLVMLTVNGQNVFCDPGTPFISFATLPWYETAVPGLRLGKDGGGWITTPLPSSANSRIVRIANLNLAENGDLSGKLTVTFTGLKATEFRTDDRDQDETHRKKGLEDVVRGFIPVPAEVELINKPDWTSSSAPLVAEFTLNVSGWASSTGKKALLPAGLFAASEKALFQRVQRVHPIYFPYPYQTEDDIRISLPPGWQISSVPNPATLEGNVVSYVLKSEGDEDSVHINRKLSIDALLLAQKSYPVLRSFFQSVRTADEEQVLLVPRVMSSTN
jgi:transglutaminase-like putative cysteine protease